MELPEAGPHGQCRTEENCVFQLCRRNPQFFVWEYNGNRQCSEKPEHSGAHCGDDTADHADDGIDLLGFRVMLLFGKVVDPGAENKNSDDQSDDFDGQDFSSISVRMRNL